MFLALSFLLHLELNSLSGKLELKWMSPWSTSIDTWRVNWVGGLKDCGQDILQKAELHLLVLHMFSQQVHDLLTVAPIQETLQGCSSYVEAAWEDQERRWRGTGSTFSENPHPGENWEGEKDCQSQSYDTASFPRPATSCHLKRSKNLLSLEATWALDINSTSPRHIKQLSVIHWIPASILSFPVKCWWLTDSDLYLTVGELDSWAEMAELQKKLLSKVLTLCHHSPCLCL